MDKSKITAIINKPKSELLEKGRMLNVYCESLSSTPSCLICSFLPYDVFLQEADKVSFLRVKPPTKECVHCRRCEDSCSMKVNPYSSTTFLLEFHLYLYSYYVLN